MSIPFAREIEETIDQRSTGWLVRVAVAVTKELRRRLLGR